MNERERTMWYVIRSDELYHHGIKGQKWGIRRFQNPDGTLTAAGRQRVGASGHHEKTGSSTQKKDSPKKKPIDSEKLKKVLAVGAAVTAATAVGVLASRSFNREANVLDGFLKEYGDTIIGGQQTLSNKLSDLDRTARSDNLGFQEASARAEKLYSDNERNISEARSRLRLSSDYTRKYTDRSLDTLAAKRHFQGKLKASDYLAVRAEQGKQAVQKFLKAA